MAKDCNYKQIAHLRIHELREGINIKVLSYPFFPVFPTESDLELVNRVASGDLHSLADKTKVCTEGANSIA